MKWESVKISSTPFLRFIDMAFENLPDDLMEKITRTISNLHLESRSNIEAQFRTFVELCRSSSTPQMLIVKGEWGEGKTTLLNVYINKLQKEYSAEIISYHTRMDRVLDILEKKLRKNIRLSIHNLFLAAIVEDIANVLKMNGSPLSLQLQKIGEITREEQIFEAIDVLANDHKHLIFFIDEFEAIIGRKNIIINQVEIVQAIIRAIRAIRGGELKRLITNTEVVPHFVFAMTPYAYSEYVHRMGIEFKGWEQRRRYLIELEPVTRKDVEIVITHLIKEIYFSKDIDILDLLEDRRYLDILFTISQGNLGSLITAFNLVLAAAKRKHSEVFGTEGMVKINADLIIEVFTQNKIYTYVGETEGIDRVLYNECTEFLKQNMKDKKCLEIWKKLVATSSVLFEDEVDERDIERLNKVLFNKLGKTVVSKVELYPINTNVEESLVKLLKENNENINKNTLLIALRRIMMCLGDKRYLPLPSYEESAKMSLRDTLSKMLSFSMIINVSSKTLEKMYEILKENSEKNNEQILIGYAISQQVRERLYPAPPIFILDFVDPSKALQLWKMAYDSVTDNPTLVEKNVRLLLINKIPEIDIKNQMPVFYYQYGGQIVKLDVEVFVFVYFNKKRLEILEKTIKQGKIAILITKDSIYNTVLTELKEENLHKKSLVIPISEITLIQLAIIQELLQRKRRKELDFRVEEPRLENKLAEIITSLELANEMNRLINKLRTDGYVLEEFKLVSEKGVDELIDFYFMYLIGGSEFTIKELWRNHLKKISDTLLYGRNVRKP
ncbi:MAG: P-loop NTPase fold protein, partial [Candidatus Heimdallarchaeaceae archaeon]